MYGRITVASQAAVIENGDALKQLNSRAHGEVAFREAIQELEMWAAQVSDYGRSRDGTAKALVCDAGVFLVYGKRLWRAARPLCGHRFVQQVRF